MDEPKIRMYPTELFGHVYTEYSSPGKARDDMDAQHCPFLDSECTKFRKSEPSVKIGTCSLGWSGGRDKTWHPSVTCPERLYSDDVFRSLKRMIYGENAVHVVKEANMGRGSFDYVFVKCDETGGIDDFCCVEFQTNGTTGTPWQGIVDIKKRGKYLKDAYKYNFNLANQYQKTMMQQVYKKGLIAEDWGKHLIFLLQDSGMAYLRRSITSDMTGLKPNTAMSIKGKERFIHFALFTMKWKSTRWVPVITELYDTTSSDVVNMLGSSHEIPVDGLDKFMDTLRGRIGGSAVVR